MTRAPQWLDLGEDEPGKLCNGQLQEEEAPDLAHELTISWLVFVLRSWLPGRGSVVGSELKIGRRLPDDFCPHVHGNLVPV